MRKKTLAVAWIDYKKAYGSTFPDCRVCQYGWAE